jgi:hypothetical protein
VNRRENTLRAVRFENPDYIPMHFHINPACWYAYPQGALQELMASHPFLFPNYQPFSEPSEPELDFNQRAAAPYTDDWGCVWQTLQDGISGAVVEHPLADWAAFDVYQPPDPAESDGLGPIDWDDIRNDLQCKRERDELRQVELRHGHTFLRLQDLRGYENVIFDMVDSDPRLMELINMVEAFNFALVQRYVDAGAEWIGFPDDLGMQNGPMLSPEHFRRFIRPSYERLMHFARHDGCLVHMHSDGDIRALAEDLIACGVNVLNLQDRVNGIDWIAENIAGRVCIELDIDRQAVTRFGTPTAIDAMLRDTIERLGSPQGGLMMVYGLYPDVPLENAAALMDAMTRYAGLD